MTEEITASMTYDAESMAPALRWHHHRLNRVSLKVGLAALVLCVLLYAGAHVVTSQGVLINRPVIMAAPAFVVVLIFLTRWLGPVLFARSVRSSPAHGRPLIYRINEQGVKVSVADGRAEYGWHQFLRSLVTPDGVLLYTQKLAFNWLPKTAFTTETDYARFLGLVTAKTPHSRLG